MWNFTKIGNAILFIKQIILLQIFKTISLDILLESIFSEFATFCVWENLVQEIKHNYEQKKKTFKQCLREWSQICRN